MAVLVGIMAGIGFSIKPYFLITLFCIELLVSYRKKSVFSWLRIESIIAILIIFLYGLSVLIYYPEFLSIVVPLWIPFYYARIEPWINILDCFYFVFCCAAIALSCFNYDKEPYSMIKMVFVVTILGDLIVFLIPRTTWYYHILPAFSIACLYFTLILGELSQEKSINPSRGADKSAIIQMATLVPFFMLVFACASETIKKIAYFHSDNSMNKIIAFINKRQSDHSYDFFSITHRLNILEYYSTMKYVGTFPFFWEFSKLLPKQDALVYLNTSLPYVLNIISHDLNDKKPQFIIIDKIAAEWYLNQRIDYPKEYSKNKSFREAWSHYNYLETIEFFDIYQREKQ